jgi:hypothetical protein
MVFNAEERSLDPTPHLFGYYGTFAIFLYTRAENGLFFKAVWLCLWKQRIMVVPARILFRFMICFKKYPWLAWQVPSGAIVSRTGLWIFRNFADHALISHTRNWLAKLGTLESTKGPSLPKLHKALYSFAKPGLPHKALASHTRPWLTT